MMYPDNVQQIQSSRGRHAVDQLLWELGQRLPNFIRNEDIPCLYHGDVFCVIMPGAELKITRDRAEKIRNEISQLQISYGNAILSTTLSLGVSVLPVHAVDVETLICAAEASMQMASNNGGNQVVLADALQQM
jgi:diguanylate cyclase (GGDEF)-like protein